MKRLIILIPFIAILCSCSNNQPTAEEQKAKQDSILQAQQDSLMDAFKLELDDIALVVNEVGTRNGLFDLDSSEGQSLSKEQIIKKVQGLDVILNKNQQKLDDIYKRMRSSKLKNDELEKMIKSMQESISSRETQINDLMGMLEDKDLQIVDIKNRVDSMRKDNIMLTEEVVQMDEKMHKVHYVVGDQKELRDQGIVTKEGGLLGIGGTKKLDVSQLDASQFTTTDQRELVSIPLYSKKAKLITNHPEGSYAFITDEEGNVSTLEITDKAKFWTATDYLVVEVDN